VPLAVKEAISRGQPEAARFLTAVGEHDLQAVAAGRGLEGQFEGVRGDHLGQIDSIVEAPAHRSGAAVGRRQPAQCGGVGTHARIVDHARARRVLKALDAEEGIEIIAVEKEDRGVGRRPGCGHTEIDVGELEAGAAD